MPCSGSKKSPRTSAIVRIILSFWSFEISEDILRIGLDSFSKLGFYMFSPFGFYLSFTSFLNFIVDTMN